MLFRQEVSVMDVLNESMYLQPLETFSPQMIPLVLLDEDTPLLDYDYIKRMMSDIGVNLDEAKIAIAEANEIDPSTIVIAIPEYEMILNPTLREDVGNFVLTPIPMTSDVYSLCETCLSLYEETMNETFLHLLIENDVQAMFDSIRNDPTLSDDDKAAAINSMLRVSRREEDTAKKREEEAARRAAALEQGKKDAVQKLKDFEALKQQQAREARAKRYLNDSRNRRNGGGFFNGLSNLWNNRSDTTKKVVKGGLAAIGAAGVGLGIKNHLDNVNTRMSNMEANNAAITDQLKRIQAEAKNAPTTFLAKKIAALRGLYKNYLEKARMERSEQRAGIFKTIASKILGVIDFLLKKLQNVVN